MATWWLYIYIYICSLELQFKKAVIFNLWLVFQSNLNCLKGEGLVTFLLKIDPR